MKLFVVVAILLVAVIAQDKTKTTNVNVKCTDAAKTLPAGCNKDWPAQCTDTAQPDCVKWQKDDQAKKNTLKFIEDGTPEKNLPDAKGFTPKVMNHKDARDVLRKLVKEKDTAFVIQFFKGAPDRDLRDDLLRYVLIPKTSANYGFQAKYEYAEVDVDNSLYKDLIDNLSFKQKFDQHDFPYVLYSYQGKGYMVHGPGIAREVFDLRNEVEKNAKKEAPATPPPATGNAAAPKTK